MALRSPYEYMTKEYPSLARVEFLLVVIWLLIDTLYNVLPNPQCPGPFSVNTCKLLINDFILDIPRWPKWNSFKTSFRKTRGITTLCAYIKISSHIENGDTFSFLFFSFPFTCLFMLIMYSSVFAAFLISSSVMGNSLTVLINTSFSSCSCSSHCFFQQFSVVQD